MARWIAPAEGAVRAAALTAAGAGDAGTLGGWGDTTAVVGLVVGWDVLDGELVGTDGMVGELPAVEVPRLEALVVVTAPGGACAGWVVGVGGASAATRCAAPAEIDVGAGATRRAPWRRGTFGRGAAAMFPGSSGNATTTAPKVRQPATPAAPSVKHLVYVPSIMSILFSRRVKYYICNLMLFYVL